MITKAAGALVLLFAGVANAQVGVNVDVETKVREYFAATPVMIEIARCESKFRQYADSGNPLMGGYGGAMVGVFQVHSTVHANFAESLGMDVYTLDGNLEYAKYLYEREGTNPWISSFPCWNTTDVDEGTPASTDSNAITVNLSFGMEHPQVLILQKRLNALGVTIAPDGPGSPGQETIKFGFLTRDAVKKFQCARNIACGGDEHTNGYGFVGARTRAALAVDAPIPSPESNGPPAEPVPAPSSAEAEQIAALQAQIAELTKILAELLAKQNQ
ncbi:MAG: peptidoglycan-binding domain-containing protein [Minisyncoccia bacterium]